MENVWTGRSADCCVIWALALIDASDQAIAFTSAIPTRLFAVIAYSITAARSNNDCGILIPIASAVLRLMTSSDFVGCSMGRSAGLAPLRILSAYPAARQP